SWSFPKLNGNNYYAWSENMQAALEARQLWWGFIEYKSPPPSEPSATPPKSEDDMNQYSPEYTLWEKHWEKYNDWVQKDCSAMGLIKGAIESTQWPHIRTATTSKEMWNA
ncbi:hypothetical protein P691DRAFT_610889, partial [Macrolepiota fuliginosa MF-IS2]